MSLYIDQTGRAISISSSPQRIISLVPSQTELLYHLGLDESVVGITKFCIHPEHWFRSKQRIGGTKNVNHEIIARLKPDLIIGNKEENTKDEIEKLAQQFPVWLSNISKLNEAIDMIRQLSFITSTTIKGEKLISAIQASFSNLIPISKPLKVCYLIWQNPYITVGGDTFISDMLNRCGFINVYAETPRYPEITLADMAAREIDIVLLSSEPFPFKEKHLFELQSQLTGPQIMLADGELFSWYGSRLLKSPGYFQTLINKLQ